jgi:hypothetical protein
MKPVAPQDRPKMVVVLFGIVIALGFVVRNLLGTQVLAGSSQSVPPPAARVPGAAVAANATVDAEQVPASGAAAAASDAAFADAAVPVQPWVHDPFHPIAHPTLTEHSAGVPASAVPLDRVVPVLPDTRAAGEAAPRPAAPKRGGAVAQAVKPAPGYPSRSGGWMPVALRSFGEQGRDGGTRCAGPGFRAVEQPLPLPRDPARVAAADPAVPVTLTGTVGSGAAAVAMFRMGTESRFLRPQEVIAGWRVTDIQVGQVWLSRQGHRQQLHAGEPLENTPIWQAESSGVSPQELAVTKSTAVGAFVGTDN